MLLFYFFLYSLNFFYSYSLDYWKRSLSLCHHDDCRVDDATKSCSLAINHLEQAIEDLREKETQVCFFGFCFSLLLFSLPSINHSFIPMSSHFFGRRHQILSKYRSVIIFLSFYLIFRTYFFCSLFPPLEKTSLVHFYPCLNVEIGIRKQFANCSTNALFPQCFESCQCE